MQTKAAQKKQKKTLSDTQKSINLEITKTDHNPFALKSELQTTHQFLASKLNSYRQINDNLLKMLEKPPITQFDLSDEVIKSSPQYKSLQYQISKNDHESESEQRYLAELKQQLEEEIEASQHKNHHFKMHLWQIKNQLLELQETYNDQKIENQRLQQEISVLPDIDQDPLSDDGEESNQYPYKSYKSNHEDELNFPQEPSEEDEMEMDIDQEIVQLSASLKAKQCKKFESQMAEMSHYQDEDS